MLLLRATALFAPLLLACVTCGGPSSSPAGEEPDRSGSAPVHTAETKPPRAKGRTARTGDRGAPRSPGSVATAVGVTPTSSTGPARFGVHAPGRPSSAAASGAKMIRRIVHWDHLEPRRGEFRWDEAYNLVKSYQAAGLDIVFTFRCNSVAWGSTFVQKDDIKAPYQVKSSMPKSIDDWRNYVRAVVEKFDGDGRDDMPGLSRPIRYWQFENEFVYQWAGTADELAELTRVTYETIKEASPEAVVIGPSLYNVNPFALRDGINTRGWFYRGSDDSRRQKVTREQILRQPDKGYELATDYIRQAHPYFDVVDLHVYVMDEEEVGYVVQWTEDQLRKAGADKPIWCLEFAVPYHEFTDLKFNRSVVQSQIVAFDLGIEKIFWNSIMPVTNHENFRRLSLETEGGERKRAFYNYALAAALLDRFQSVDRVEAGSGVQAYRFDFDAPGRSVWVAWTDGAPSNFSLATSSNLTMTGLVAEGDQKPSESTTLKPKNGRVEVKVTEDPVFLSTQP